MSIDNNKFIALLLSQEDIDVQEEWERFSPEEQEIFFDQLIQMSIWAASQMGDIPREIKLQIGGQLIIQMLSQMPLETRQVYLEVFSNEDAINSLKENVMENEKESLIVQGKAKLTRLEKFQCAVNVLATVALGLSIHRMLQQHKLIGELTERVATMASEIVVNNAEKVAKVAAKTATKTATTTA